MATRDIPSAPPTQPVTPGEDDEVSNIMNMFGVTVGPPTQEDSDSLLEDVDNFQAMIEHHLDTCIDMFRQSEVVPKEREIERLRHELEQERRQRVECEARLRQELELEKVNRVECEAKMRQELEVEKVKRVDCEARLRQELEVEKLKRVECEEKWKKELEEVRGQREECEQRLRSELEEEKGQTANCEKKSEGLVEFICVMQEECAKLFENLIAISSPKSSTKENAFLCLGPFPNVAVAAELVKVLGDLSTEFKNQFAKLSHAKTALEKVNTFLSQSKSAEEVILLSSDDEEEEEVDYESQAQLLHEQSAKAIEPPPSSPPHPPTPPLALEPPVLSPVPPPSSPPQPPTVPIAPPVLSLVPLPVPPPVRDPPPSLCPVPPQNMYGLPPEIADLIGEIPMEPPIQTRRSTRRAPSSCTVTSPHSQIHGIDHSKKQWGNFCLCGMKVRYITQLMAHVKFCSRNSNSAIGAGALVPYEGGSQEEGEEVEHRHDTLNTSTPFTCTCGNMYLSKSSLNLHIKRKRYGKVFHCFLCPYRFYSHSLLKKHAREVHGVEYSDKERYGCNSCGETFPSMNKCLFHRLNAHPDSDNEWTNDTPSPEPPQLYPEYNDIGLGEQMSPGGPVEEDRRNRPQASSSSSRAVATITAPRTVTLADIKAEDDSDDDVICLN